jgi:hypothetical protein
MGAQPLSMLYLIFFPRVHPAKDANANVVRSTIAIFLSFFIVFFLDANYRRKKAPLSITALAIR